MLTQEEIKKLDVKALDKKATELRKKLFDFKMQKSTSGSEKPHVKGDVKKALARVLTERTVKLKK